MEQRKNNRQIVKLLVIPVTLAVMAMFTQGCSGERKCGCGIDLNTVYKAKKHRYR